MKCFFRLSLTLRRLLLCCVIVPPLILGALQLARAQGPGPAGSLGEPHGHASNNGGRMIHAGAQDHGIRDWVGSAFLTIEGAHGAIGMVLLGIAAITAAAMRRFKMAISFFLGAAAIFALRAAVAFSFGPDAGKPAG